MRGGGEGALREQVQVFPDDDDDVSARSVHLLDWKPAVVVGVVSGGRVVVVGV